MAPVFVDAHLAHADLCKAMAMGEDDPLLGRTLAGRYRLIAPLGDGGMSTVYLARHVLIERLNAIKVLHESLSNDVASNERFLREARAVNRINHPNIVEISDFGDVTLTLEEEPPRKRHVVYLVMEYVPGESLHRVLTRGKLPISRVLPIGIQIAQALARAHQTGVIHRDLKPENILLVPRRDGVDVAKLTDFGVAKIATGQRATVGDQVFGTPGYLAPEYLVGETAIDGRADLFSLGVVLYEALAGVQPWEANNPAELLVKPMSEPPTPLRERVSGVPERVESTIMRLLSARPDDRPRDAFALIELLSGAAGSAGVTVDASARLDSFLPPAAEAALRAPLGALPSREPPSRRGAGVHPPPPRLGELTPPALVDAWRAHGASLARAVDELPADLRAELDDVMARRAGLLERLGRIVSRAADRQRAIDALEERGRDFRRTLGRAIDVIAADLSRSHRAVIELMTRRTELHMLRRAASRDPGRADALLWEEAAVDDDLRKARVATDDLGHQLASLQDALFARNSAHEDTVQRAAGGLEGEMAALATVHRELELTGQEVARALGG